MNRWLTLAANLGVLGGIMLVVVELAQNREAIRSQTRNEVAVQIVDLLRDVSTDPQLAELLTRATAGGPLTEAERTQHRHRVLAMLRYFENVHYQYRQSLYDEAEFLSQEEAWRSFMSDASAVAVWCDRRSTFSPEFAQAFDRLLANPPAGGKQPVV